MSSLCHKAARLLLVIALVSSCGAHWVVLQSVAWTAMLVTRSAESSVIAAVKSTFDGAHPCQLCQGIQKGRQSEKRQSVRYTVAKLHLVCQSSPVMLYPPAKAQDWASVEEASEPRTSRPISPPPRRGC